VFAVLGWSCCSTRAGVVGWWWTGSRHRVTIIRPWRGNTWPWTRCSGLVYTGVQSQAPARGKVRLLVLTENEDALGPATIEPRGCGQRFATGLALPCTAMEQDCTRGDDNRGVLCAQVA